MRTFDLSPLYRSTVGFDRLFSMMDAFDSAPGYPPYNIERTGENDYRITVAVAGNHTSALWSTAGTATIRASHHLSPRVCAENLRRWPFRNARRVL